jgi:hypothetical protein
VSTPTKTPRAPHTFNAASVPFSRKTTMKMPPTNAIRATAMTADGHVGLLDPAPEDPPESTLMPPRLPFSAAARLPHNPVGQGCHVAEIIPPDDTGVKITAIVFGRNSSLALPTTHVISGHHAWWRASWPGGAGRAESGWRQVPGDGSYGRQREAPRPVSNPARRALFRSVEGGRWPLPRVREPPELFPRACVAAVFAKPVDELGNDLPD